MHSRIAHAVILIAVIVKQLPSLTVAAEAPAADGAIFRRDNLIAWCIVPFDAKKRGPEERAAMLARLGFRHFAYDYRAEHVPTFEAEILACKKHGVSLDAWWFPKSLNAEAKQILELCRKHDVRPQLWISGGGESTKTPAEQQQRIAQEIERIRPIAEAAAAQGMKVGLYNHGGWFGEPENQLAMIEQLKLPNVGIVYNLHHGHDQLPRFTELLRKMMPHLLVLNLNGMVPNGDKHGQKILQLGQGTLDLELLRTIRASGYRGPIGILGHTQDDAEARLQDNLDGLDWLLPQLDGKPPGRKPQPRTPMPGAKSMTKVDPSNAANQSGWLIAGRDDYRRPPLTIACKATLTQNKTYNILVACDTKRSGAHWELFTLPGSGFMNAYLPGCTPDHVRTTVAIADGKPHDVVLTLESDRARISIDGKLAAEQTIHSRAQPTGAGDLAVGRLVEGGLGSSGTFEYLHLLRGADVPEAPNKLYAERTLGFWRFDDTKQAVSADLSSHNNPARRAAAATSAELPRGRAPPPSPGPHLKPADARLQTVLLDRSPGDVYLGVKVDEAGNIFVGGREAVFVFEPTSDDGYGPRRELLRFPADSIIMGLEFRGDDLYVLTASALYLVPEGRTRRIDLKPQRILWGLPLDLHVSFHCLAWGPDGDLYLTHGDPLLQYGDWDRPDHWGHWTLFCGREGRPLPYTGQGAVLRMKPDGTDVRVVARGLRGPVGLAFDSAGNLFTNDNDHESRADRYAPSRLLHVVDGVDFGWPRGWMASKSPDRFDLIEPMCDLGRGVPCDLTYYDRPLYADLFGDKLLMCRWDRHSVTAYRPVRRGTTFHAAEETIAVGDENCRPVGIATDRSGRLFVTAVYMSGNMAAPDCASDLLMIVPKNKDATQAVPSNAANDKTIAATASPLDDARSDDPYRRQLGAMKLAEQSSAVALQKLAAAEDEPTRLAAVLAVGRKLTVPDSHFIPPAKLELFYPKGSSYFHRQHAFYGVAEMIDLADVGRVGSFTIAQWWAGVERTPEQETLFAALTTSLADDSDRVRLQAAYSLSLLRDPRSESLVDRTRREVQLRRLQAATEHRIAQAWAIGPFDGRDDSDGAARPDRGPLDLTANYGARTWQVRPLIISAKSGAVYFHFRVHSGTRQAALLTATAGVERAWQNESSLQDVISEATGVGRRWIVDLQPGSNDFLVRADAASPIDLRLKAVQKLDVSLPEKLDSGQLTERLRSAATSGSAQPISAELAAVDWSQAVRQGDAAAGRKLFGTLGCAKCHAVVPDQKSAGAPSLFEAQRRFTIPQLVESVLLPSRQVAEPFRAQSFVTVDGRTLNGLVTNETADVVELLLPDASRTTLAKSQIEERAPTVLSPMPQGLIKTPDELQHLLAYLLSERPLPP